MLEQVLSWSDTHAHKWKAGNCKWKVPKKRKESNLTMSGTVFEKHDFDKQKRRKISHKEDFDPLPIELRGNAQSLLKKFLDTVHGASLWVSVMFDSQYCHQSIPATQPDMLSACVIKKTIASFKASLKMSADKLHEIEQNTTAQRDSPLWFSCRRYRITASRFGDILRRRADTPPDSLGTSPLLLCHYRLGCTKRASCYSRVDDLPTRPGTGYCCRSLWVHGMRVISIPWSYSWWYCPWSIWHKATIWLHWSEMPLHTKGLYSSWSNQITWFLLWATVEPWWHSDS